MKKVSQGKLNKRKKFYKRNKFSAKINLNYYSLNK